MYPVRKILPDPLSRGVMPDLLNELKIWWSGPPWLKSNETEWSSENFHASDVKLPQVRDTILVAEMKQPQHNIFDRFSKLSRLIRVIVFCCRFIKNCKMRKINSSYSDNKSKIQPLSIEELEQSRLSLVKMVQRDTFKTELCDLKNNKHVSKKISILRLNRSLMCIAF